MLSPILILYYNHCKINWYGLIPVLTYNMFIYFCISTYKEQFIMDKAIFLISYIYIIKPNKFK